MSEAFTNVGHRLSETARRDPDGVAVVEPLPKRGGPLRRYRQLSFRELDDDSTRIAAGLSEFGMRPGMRIVLMVRPGIDFISLVFALFKAGIVTVLIDPGLGRRNLVRCLEQVEPQGFIAIPLAQAVRLVLRRRFPRATLNVTVGKRWGWSGPTLDQVRLSAAPSQFAPTTRDDPAAIIFTSGSTGPPKGVLYRHGNFDQQVDEIRDRYGIQPGEVDVPGFPLFALFNAAMGVTTVIPDMDFSRPAQADPENIIEAVRDWKATQAFGSPALWNVVGRFCEAHHVSLPTLRRVLSAGAPVPVHVLRRMKQAIHPEGEMHTPYGATEALPVASISANEVLQHTARRSLEGAGTCVGSRFPGITWKVIQITDDPIERLDQVQTLPVGEIGELIVSGPVVTTHYVTQVEANGLHKIHDGTAVWHRMGDVGYLDETDRFWFCGRKAHRVRTQAGTLFTIPCEAIFNAHDSIYRSALVGVGARGDQIPVVVAEPWPERRPVSAAAEKSLLAELAALALRHPFTAKIEHIFLTRALPVDIRHNSKIFREQVAVWVEPKLRRGRSSNPRRSSS